MATRSPYLRLLPHIVSIAAGEGVAVYSGSGALLLQGPDAGVVVEAMFPLLDGSRTASEVFAAMPEFAQSDLIGVVDALRDHGFLAESRARHAARTRDEERRLRLRDAGVVLAGAEQWLSATAAALRAAGIAHVERLRLEDAGQPDIAIGIFEGSDTTGPWPFAASARQRGVPSLISVVADDEVRIGPLAVPGRSACWHCCQVRLTANSAWDDSVGHPVGVTADTEALVASLIAREVCAALGPAEESSTLADHVLIVDRRSLQASRHRILGVPGCELCGGPTDSPPTHRISDDPAPAPGWLVDSRTGVVNRVVIEPRTATGLDRPIIATAIPADAPDPSGPQRPMPVGWGKGLTASEAIRSAIGEAIERYAASLPDPARIVWSRPADLPGEVLDPRGLALYEDEQYARGDFPFVPFDPEVPHPWTMGAWLDDEQPVWVPAILAYLSLDVRREHVFCQGTSNGLAAGTDRADAALRAILELLERDAFMTSWRTRQPGERVRLDRTLDADLAVIVRGIEAFGGQVELSLLPTPCGYPTALWLAFGDGVRWPGVTLGLATDPDARTAVRRALLELGQTGPYLRRMMKTGRRPVPARSQDVVQMLDHAIYYFPAPRARALDYLRDDAKACALADLPHSPERSFSACARALAAAGVRVALVDVTSADIATTPLRVMRAISPDLQPISFGHGLERRSVPRLLARGAPAAPDDIAPIW